MRDSEKTAWALLGVVSLIFVGMPLSVVWSGYVLSVLWGWFVVPTLAAPPLSVPAAIGISAIVSYMTYQRPKNDSESSDVLRAMVLMVGKPAFALIFGYVVKQFL